MRAKPRGTEGGAELWIQVMEAAEGLSPPVQSLFPT